VGQRIRRPGRLTVALVACAVSACSIAPAGAEIPPEASSAARSQAAPTPATAVNQGAFVTKADGYTLTVTADRIPVAPGQAVTLIATFENGTSAPIDVAGPECRGGSTGSVFVDLPVQPKGKAWSGIRQTFKEYVLTKGLGAGGGLALDPFRVDIAPPECGEWTDSFELGPGDAASSTMAWTAEIVPGVDALAGKAHFGVSVGYDQQNEAPSYPPGYTGVRGSWVPIFKHLSVSGELDIMGQSKPLKGAGEVIDAALADKTFSSWLAQRPEETWSNANLFLLSRPSAEGSVPKGPAWELDLFREVGVPRDWAIVFVDPFDGSLISATYCGLPCDR
jgi:hypothetical protein